MFDIVINHGILLTSERDYRPWCGHIGIKNGLICQIRSQPIPEEEGSEYFDAAHKIVLPGLINGHCHGDMTILRGLLDQLTLQEQNQVMGKSGWLKNYLTDEIRLISRQLTYLEAIKSGTTFLMENMYWDLGLDAVRAMAETGLSGALALGVRTHFAVQREYHAMEYLSRFGACAEEHHLLPVLGTVAEEDFDDTILDDITRMARQLGWLTTQHLAETTWRQAHVKERFGTTSIRYLADRGFLHDRIIGSHAVYVEPEEIQLLKEKGVRIVNTPLCEAKIADGLAPIPAFLKAGIPVGLGTDGALWNNSNDLFREMKGLCLLHTLHSGIHPLSHQDALNMATIGGAEVFGLSQVTGSICEGKRADLILIDTRAPHLCPLRLDQHENISSSVVYNATGADVTDSIIGGRVVMRNRKVRTVDERILLARAQAASDHLMEQCSADGVL